MAEIAVRELGVWPTRTREPSSPDSPRTVWRIALEMTVADFRDTASEIRRGYRAPAPANATGLITLAASTVMS